MALTMRGKILYSVIFLVLVPLALTAWARSTTRIVSIPAISCPPAGLALIVAGAVVLVWGMRDLWTLGGGLPMNAAPPPRYVDRGIYRVLPHPIYTGFCAICVGVSVSSGSASGLWLVSPVAMLSCAALVLGYERHDLRERFHRDLRKILPVDSSSAPSNHDCIASFFCAVMPWFAIAAIIRLQANPFAGKSAFTFNEAGNVALRSASVLVYSTCAAIAVAPIAARTSSGLRRGSLRSLTTMALSFAFCLAAPLVLNPQVVPASVLWHFEGLGSGTESAWMYFPSLPVVFALLSVNFVSTRSYWLRTIAYCWVALVAVSTLILSTPGVTLVQTELVRLGGALIASTLACYLYPIWRVIQSAAEVIANSWREWRFGPVRVINHGAYAGLAAFLAVWISTVLAGPGHLTAILFAASAAVVGAALWAQYVEGSAQLLRPYGFYGGLLGGTLGALAAPMFHTSVWLLLGVFSASGSLVQAAGRLRCLVQGCCHGKPAPAAAGIGYVHPKSRVCRLSPWTAVPLHPTPVYSILWNCLVTLLIFRLWLANSSLHLIVGLYFMLSGLGRFVEESWRGEPQTKIVAGLRLYQWAAIASLLMGVVFTAFDNGELAPDPAFRWNALLPAAVFGLVGFCAMGVDFPESTRRFSRLT